MNAIQLKDVKKCYKNGFLALDEMTLQVRQGEIFALLGPNGAGKTTLIKILTTCMQYNSGDIAILGKDLLQNRDFVRRKVACVSQSPSIDPHLTMEENMLLQGALYHIPKEQTRKRMEQLIQNFDLDKYRKYPTASYSGGVKRRVDIAIQLMSEPAILFLDEPTVGMDVEARQALWMMMRKMKQDLHTTIFLTTHYLEEAEQLSDTVCIMKEGKAIIQGAIKDLKGLWKQQWIKINFTDTSFAKQAQQLLSTTILGKEIQRKKDVIVLPVIHESDLHDIAAILLQHALPFTGLQECHNTLEDVFLHLTAKEERI